MWGICRELEYDYEEQPLVPEESWVEIEVTVDWNQPLKPKKLPND